ncbi:hypothetical protein [Paenibacillus taiwanensis]|uniref:hypothetical protein n=1 Tax=Paenibacillus taiwanensis TaxID=401638 RepID=UPI0012F98AAE|nr:hypothetical protein [Paenibacillus taiwanensis]
MRNQMTTTEQYVYSWHQRPPDTRRFIPHMKRLATSSLPLPKTVLTLAGYGREYIHLYAIREDKKTDVLLPTSSYMKEIIRRCKKNIRHASKGT